MAFYNPSQTYTAMVMQDPKFLAEKAKNKDPSNEGPTWYACLIFLATLYDDTCKVPWAWVASAAKQLSPSVWIVLKSISPPCSICSLKGLSIKMLEQGVFEGP